SEAAAVARGAGCTVPEGGSAIDVLRVYKPTIPRATRESLRAVLSRFSENGWDRGRLLLLQGDLGSLLRQTLSGVRLSGNLGGRA
ncbi:hypothetical protein EBT31_00005, partial [bacterium]|nr:hypothetical protein [bacterium]